MEIDISFLLLIIIIFVILNRNNTPSCFYHMNFVTKLRSVRLFYPCVSSFLHETNAIWFQRRDLSLTFCTSPKDPDHFKYNQGARFQRKTSLFSHCFLLRSLVLLFFFCFSFSFILKSSYYLQNTLLFMLVSSYYYVAEIKWPIKGCDNILLNFPSMHFFVKCLMGLTGINSVSPPQRMSVLNHNKKLS